MNATLSRRPAVDAEAGARLTPDHWLDAAFDAVADGGFDKARVLLLAEALGVTRGSFYWHFKDHAALVQALLARWQTREQELVRALLAQSTGDAVADLERLLDAGLAHAGADLKNMRFELALRGHGRRHPEVAAMLVEVDKARMTLFQSCFMRLTVDATRAAELATLFYLAIVGGNQALSRPATPPQAKAHLKRIITRYLISDQAD